MSVSADTSFTTISLPMSAAASASVSASATVITFVAEMYDNAVSEALAAQRGVASNLFASGVSMKTTPKSFPISPYSIFSAL